jgi:L-ascorbate metabolism protein UlaG (beta-lactamase superfamily)
MSASCDLAQQINGLAVPPGQLALWSLGQAGFVIKGGSTLAIIDPYLSNSIGEQGGPNRRFPPPLDPTDLTDVQVVFATHEHQDHTDPATLLALLASSPGALLVASPQGQQIALDAGLEQKRIFVPRVGERIAMDHLAYTAVPAAHYQYEVDEQQRARWMGFVIECNGVTLYHSGDTIMTPELLPALDAFTLDLALLPINGRDFFREEQEIVGNLWPGEAIQLAQRLTPRVLIGMHNDLFAENRVRPGLLFDEMDRLAPFLRCHLLQPGELYLYAG